MAGFIDALPISVADKKKLRILGADSPAALYSLIEAAPTAFESFMGGAARVVRERLQHLVSATESARATCDTTEFPLGAELSQPPRLREPPYDVVLRDRLFSELQDLRRNPVTRNGARAKQLEQELNLLLEK
jgi:hypothetical protein